MNKEFIKMQHEAAEKKLKIACIRQLKKYLKRIRNALLHVLSAASVNFPKYQCAPTNTEIDST